MNDTILPNASGGTTDPVAKKLLHAAQYVLVVVFGVLPIFFIPSTTAPFTYSKTLFVTIGLFLALILFSFSMLRTGSVSVRVALPLVLLWIVVGVALASAVFSGDIRDALVGNALGVQTALFVALLALTATVWSCFGSNKVAVLRLFILLSFSTLLLALFHIGRLFLGSDALTLGVFSGAATASPFGGWNDLGIFFGLIVIISLVALERLRIAGWPKGLFVVVILLSLAMLAVVNFTAVWVVLGLVSLSIVLYILRRGGVESVVKQSRSFSPKSDHTSLFIAITVFLVSVLFVIAGSLLGNTISQMTNVSYLEVRPSFTATADIATQVYQEDALLGVGPNRFVDAWREHKSPSINNTIFWSTDFESGVGYILTAFITLGMLGGLAWLAFFLSFLYMGVRAISGSDKTDQTWYFIGIASFVGALYIWGMAFMYVPGATLLLLGALFTGLTVASYYSVRAKDPVLRVGSSSGTNFVLVAVATLLVIGSIAALYYIGKHYTSVYLFNQSVAVINSGSDIDNAEELTVQSFTLFADDRSARRVAEYQLARIATLLRVSDPTEEERTRFSNAVANGQQAGRLATELDGTDAQNWAVLGNVYYALVSGQVEGAYTEAKKAFERARELDPHNPARVLSLAQLELANGNREGARNLAQTAVEMKPDYREAIYFLSQVSILLGELEQALQSARDMTVLEPRNPVHYFQIGLIQLQLDNANEAVSALERAVALEADYANARYYLALGYDILGRTTAARTQLERVLELNPGNSQVMRLLTALENGESLQSVAPEPTNRQSEADAPVEETDNVTETEDGAVVSEEDPNTPLVSPVNAIGDQPSEGVNSTSSPAGNE